MENNKMAKDTVKEAHESHAPVYDLGNRICRSTVAVIDTMVQRVQSKVKNYLHSVSYVTRQYR